MGARAALGSPEDHVARQYYEIHQGDIAVWIHMGLMQVAPVVKIDLRGFWKIHWLSAEGLVGRSACAIS